MTVSPRPLAAVSVALTAPPRQEFWLRLTSVKAKNRRLFRLHPCFFLARQAAKTDTVLLVCDCSAVKRRSRERCIACPLHMVEAVAALRFPAVSNWRMQILMDRNNNGTLTAQEREELESLVELSETISLVRADALELLRRVSQ